MGLIVHGPDNKVPLSQWIVPTMKNQKPLVCQLDSIAFEGGDDFLKNERFSTKLATIKSFSSSCVSKGNGRHSNYPRMWLSSLDRQTKKSTFDSFKKCVWRTSLQEQ